MKHTALELIDGLIGCWSDWESNEGFYLEVLAPAIVRDEGAGHLMANEQEIVRELRGMLSASEWRRLPELIAGRRAGTLDEIESDRSRKKRRLERERREEEQRRQREEERLERERREEEQRRQRDAELRIRKQALIDRARTAFESEFLSADESFRRDPDHGLLSDAEYSELKVQFVQEWATRELDQPLDVQQAASVACIGGDVQVVARAGAGKTRTLVTKALFLQKHCGVSPSELLLLAFNRAAALEMRDRLGSVLKGDVPHVMTFHALAYALVHPEEELLYDEPSVGSQGLSREIQRVIDEHLQSEHYRPLIRDLMLAHFRDDWERIVEGGFHMRIDDLIEHRKALPRETLKGEYVKSFGERLIANTLFQHGIEYKYERNFRMKGVNYRPDFTILLPDRPGVVIEYFGLKGDSDYDEMSERKRRFWAEQKEWSLLEFSPRDITSRGAEGFATMLVARLKEAGVIARRLTDEELWERIRRRAIDRFTGAVRSFVSRCRKRNLSPDELRRAIEGHSPITESERLFLEVGSSVYCSYLQRLEDGHQEDFDGLIWRAIAVLAEGQGRFARDKGRERGDLKRMRFVLVDEFQDFSEMFYSIAQGIRLLNPGAEFFCVGDDWQAINGFAGSDLRYFESFETFFRKTTTLSVSTNYRSPAQVVKLGNALMEGRGVPALSHQADPGWVRTACLSDFAPSPAERERHNGDEATPAVLRLVKRLIDRGDDVVMLSRRNTPPWYVCYATDRPGELDGTERFAEHIRSFLPVEDRGRVTASTAHKYKGLEKEAVIVLDADEGCYPLVHPNWVFLRVFGDSVERIVSEERRLFYVALTRSQRSLVILSDDSRCESSYLGDIKSRMNLTPIVWGNLPPVPSLDGARLEVRVRFPYDVDLNEQLKKQRYSWEGRGKYWCRAVTADDFDMAVLLAQPWARHGNVRIEVLTENGELVEQ